MKWSFSFGVGAIASFILFVALILLFSFQLFNPFLLFLIGVAVWAFTVILGFLSLAYDKRMPRFIGVITLVLAALTLILIIGFLRSGA